MFENENDRTQSRGPEVPFPAPDYSASPKPPAPTSAKRRSGAMIAIALCCSILGSILGAGGVLLVQRIGKTQTPSTQPQDHTGILQGIRQENVIDITQIQTGQLLTAAEVYAANVNSTVGITTSITTTNFWGYQSTSAASGSGFIISSDGYILTNHHVVEGSSAVTVSMFDGKEYEAQIRGYDESNDIAVLKIEATGLSPVILGDSDTLNVGDDVVAIDNPLGELTFSLTAGKISAKDREVTFSNNVTMDLLQTDCAINSGNSGGALFNMYGEVVGVTNAKYSGSSGSGATIDNIGFAIPYASIRSIVESIIEKGYVTKPYLGVSVIDVDDRYQLYGLPQGAAVQSIAENSPAQTAGLQTGDIITHVDGEAIDTGTALVRFIRDSQPGDRMTLTVYRKGQTLDITVTVSEQIRDEQEQTATPIRPLPDGR